MTRKEFVSSDNKRLVYRLHCLETAYDAILDAALPGFLPEERREDADYVLEQKMRYHAAFSQACVDAMADNQAWPPFPESLSRFEDQFKNAVISLQSVNGYPFPIYDADNQAMLREGQSEGLMFDQAGSVPEQPMILTNASGELYAFTEEGIYKQMQSGKGVDDSGRLPVASGEFGGLARAADRAKLDTYLKNAGILAMNEFLKSKGELPLSLSECCRMHDKMEEGGREGVLPYDLKDVYFAFAASRRFPEFAEVPSFAEFEAHVHANGRDFTKPENQTGVVRWLSGRGRTDGQAYEFLDLFGKDAHGERYVNYGSVQAFVNADIEAQANVLGLTPARVKKGRDGVSYVDSEGNPVAASEALLKPVLLGRRYLPLIPAGTGDAQASMRFVDMQSLKMSKAGNLQGPMERLGLSRLRPWLRPEVYAEFEENVRGIPEVMDGTFSLDPQTVENAAAVLEALDERGIAYEVKCAPDAQGDLSAMQLTAEVKEPASISFRVMDAKFPEYIGRSYHSRTRMTNTFNHDGNLYRDANGKPMREAVKADEEMTKDLVAYGLGEPVKFRQPKGAKVLVDGHEARFVGESGVPSMQSDRDSYGITMTKAVAVKGQPRTQSKLNASYGRDNGSVFLALYSGNFQYGANQRRYANPVRIRSERSGASSDKRFRTREDAKAYVSDLMQSAEAHLRGEILTPLMDMEEREDGTVLVSAKSPDELSQAVLSDDPMIRTLQEQYRRYLTDPDAVLRDRSYGDGSMNDTLDSVYTLERLGLSGVLSDTRSREEQILDSLEQMRSEVVGDAEARTVNFANLLKYGGGRETDLLHAMQLLEREGEPLTPVSENDELSMNRVKERMAQFDPRTARDLNGSDVSPFLQRVRNTVQESLTGHGITVSSLEIDDQGIIRYTGSRVYGETEQTSATYAKDREGDPTGRDYRVVEGQIGQIFEPDSMGMVVTKYAHGDNYSMAPGYFATVRRGEGSVESRTVLRGYEQILHAKLKAELHECLTADSDTLNATRLNGVYRHLYDERYPEDYRAHFRQMGMGEEVMRATIATQKKAVRYDSRYVEESTLNARVRALKSNLVNDAAYDGYSVTGRDLSVLGWTEEGYFDDSATQASTGQGISRYLVSGADVDAEGHIMKSQRPHDRTPILQLEAMRNLHFNPPDRRTMVAGNAMHCFDITKPEATAHMTAGGWTMDDAFVISKDFAERHMVPDGEGGFRPMQKGDKICDMNGNKGVVSLVADKSMHSSRIRRNMNFNPEDAWSEDDGTIVAPVEWNGQMREVRLSASPEGRGLEDDVAHALQEQLGYGECDGVLQLYMDNPNLAVVGSPFTAPSRMNGGTARDMMSRTETLKLPDGSEVPGGIGYAPYIITDKTVDEKTHVYDDEDLKNGRGRSVSSQMLWALQARGCEELLNEFYGTDASGLRQVREKMLALGMDLDPDYNIIKGYAPHEMPDGTLEERPIVELPEVPKDPEQVTTAWQKAAVEESFARVSRTGGFLRIPFELTLASGEKTQAAEDGNGYLLPMMPAAFRSEQTYDDNTSIYHDYTRAYAQIAEQALRYQCDLVKPLKDPQKAAVRIANRQKSAQAAYDSMAQELKEQSFDNKWNDWKKRIMSRRQPGSITAVGTPDPRLDLNQVAMNREMAKHMGVPEGGRILLWRDPLLRPEGISYVEVKVDDTLHGIAMNPVMDKKYDGDFDGDTWGGVPVVGEAAQREAMEKFGVEHCLVDLGLTPDARTKDNIGLALNTGLDVASAKGRRSVDPSDLSTASLLDEACGKLAAGDDFGGYEAANAYIKERLRQSMGSTVIRYDSPQAHMDSVCEMVNIGAKGKPAGILEYAKWVGFDIDAEVDGSGKQIHVKSVRDLKIPGMLDDQDKARQKMLRNMNTEVNMATAIKSFGTGLAGAVSQKNVGFSRKGCPDGLNGDAYLRYALETTYGATQGILQAKHDAKEALQKYTILTDVLPALYGGRAIGQGPDGTWGPKSVEDGSPVWNTKQDFIDQYAALCASKQGLNFDLAKDNIEKLADCLYDGNEDRYGNDRIRRAGADKTSRDIATIDQLAYAGGSFETLVANTGRCLFDTDFTRKFAPKDGSDPSKFASLALTKGQEARLTRSVRAAAKLAEVRTVDREAAPSYRSERRAVSVSRREVGKTDYASKVVRDSDSMTASAQDAEASFAD